MPILGIMASAISGNLSSYESIATVTVSSGGLASVTFSGIPSTYKHLQIRGISLSNSGSQLYIRLNSDTGANYSMHNLLGSGASAQAQSSTSQTLIYQNFLTTTQSANPMALIVDILDYASLNKNKTTRTLFGIDTNGGGVVGLVSGSWMNSTSAVNSISLTDSGGNISQYSSFALYGIKG